MNVISTNDDFKKAVKLYFDNPEQCIQEYGAIEDWDVSRVTDMNHAFDGRDEFNADLSKWDVSNVIYMKRTFTGCKNFNQDISGWNVENVSNMNSLFFGCSNFNQNLSSWNIKSVRMMSGMFENCEKFNQDLSSWDVRNVQKMLFLFYGCSEFNQDISGWQISALANTQSMFAGCDKYSFQKPNLKEWQEINQPIIDTECCVTFNMITANDRYITCNICNKHFHFEVKELWIDNYHNCPHCKSKWNNEIVYCNC